MSSVPKVRWCLVADVNTPKMILGTCDLLLCARALLLVGELVHNGP
jgi:hypothetical protein